MGDSCNIAVTFIESIMKQSEIRKAPYDTFAHCLAVLAQTAKSKQQDCRFNRLNVEWWGDENTVLVESPLNDK